MKRADVQLKDVREGFVHVGELLDVKDPTPEEERALAVAAFDLIESVVIFGLDCLERIAQPGTVRGG